MPKTLIVGDLHLGKGFSIGKPGVGNQLNSRGSDQYSLLQWLHETCLSNHVNSIIFTGDIFEDSNPDFKLVTLFVQWLKQCESSFIDVHIVIGNHDIKRSGQKYISVLDVIQSSEFENVYIYKDIDTIFNGTTAFTLIPFRDRRTLECQTHKEAIDKLNQLMKFELPKIPPYYDKIIVGHLALEGSIPIGDEFDDSSNELMCPYSLFNGYDFVWMGHVHKPQIKRQNPHIAHIGSLDISNFGETDHKKIVIIFDSESEQKFETLYVPTRKLVNISVEYNDDVDVTADLTDKISKLNVRGSYLKIDIKLISDKPKSVDRSSIYKLASDLGVFHISSINETRSIVVVPKAKQMDVNYTVDAKGAVKLYADTVNFKSDEQKSKFISMCIDIIDEVSK